VAATFGKPELSLSAIALATAEAAATLVSRSLFVHHIRQLAKTMEALDTAVFRSLKAQDTLIIIYSIIIKTG